MIKELVFPKGGSLIFWGDIFGGRYGENYHQVLGYHLDDKVDIFSLFFDQGESCAIYDPVDISFTENKFIVKDASLVIWKWFYYGRTKSSENLLKYEYRKVDEFMVLKTENGRQTKMKTTNQVAFLFC